MSRAAEAYTADQLDAIWVSYQTQGGALCPYCEHVLTLALAEDSAVTGTEPVITVDCPGCGRHGTNDPSERNASEQNPV